MRYFEINTLGNDQDRTLAFADEGVRDLRDDGRLAAGEAVGSDFPAAARIELQLESPGLRLSSVLGNTAGYLIVSTAMKEILERFDLRSVELFPFSLFDHRRRLLSKDYWIVNPLGVFDCVDRPGSDIEYLEGDPTQIVAVNRLAFSSSKVAGAPDLFRVPESPYQYFVSERVAAAWHGHGVTNLLLVEIDLV